MMYCPMQWAAYAPSSPCPARAAACSCMRASWLLQCAADLNAAPSASSGAQPAPYTPAASCARRGRRVGCACRRREVGRKAAASVDGVAASLAVRARAERAGRTADVAADRQSHLEHVVCLLHCLWLQLPRLARPHAHAARQQLDVPHALPGRRMAAGGRFNAHAPCMHAAADAPAAAHACAHCQHMHAPAGAARRAAGCRRGPPLWPPGRAR